MPLLHVLYLHGFASSASSSKAAFFTSRLAAHGVALHTPDFNEPDFSSLTITRMIAQVGDTIARLPAAPVALIGSSLGGFVAVHAARQWPGRVDRMILLAPALDFGGNRMRQIGETGIDEWRRTNRLDVFHYGFGRVMSVHYQLYEDARGYDAVGARLDLPIQIFQGRHDASVDPASVERWAEVRPNVELHMLDDDHQLKSSLEIVWSRSAVFLGLQP
jgi:pimeloyl-ACP methyl ester carboxylesterase